MLFFLRRRCSCVDLFIFGVVWHCCWNFSTKFFFWLPIDEIKSHTNKTKRTDGKKCQCMIWEVFVKIYMKFIHRYEPWDFFFIILRLVGIFYSPSDRMWMASVFFSLYFFFFVSFESISTFSFTKWTEKMLHKKYFDRISLRCIIDIDLYSNDFWTWYLR